MCRITSTVAHLVSFSCLIGQNKLEWGELLCRWEEGWKKLVGVGRMKQNYDVERKNSTRKEWGEEKQVGVGRIKKNYNVDWGNSMRRDVLEWEEEK